MSALHLTQAVRASLGRMASTDLPVDGQPGQGSQSLPGALLMLPSPHTRH